MLRDVVIIVYVISFYFVLLVCSGKRVFVVKRIVYFRDDGVVFYFVGF